MKLYKLKKISNSQIFIQDYDQIFELWFWKTFSAIEL